MAETIQKVCRVSSSTQGSVSRVRRPSVERSEVWPSYPAWCTASFNGNQVSVSRWLRFSDRRLSSGWKPNCTDDFMRAFCEKKLQEALAKLQSRAWARNAHEPPTVCSLPVGPN